VTSLGQAARRLADLRQPLSTRQDVERLQAELERLHGDNRISLESYRHLADALMRGLSADESTERNVIAGPARVARHGGTRPRPAAGHPTEAVVRPMHRRVDELAAENAALQRNPFAEDAGDAAGSNVRTADDARLSSPERDSRRVRRREN